MITQADNAQALRKSLDRPTRAQGQAQVPEPLWGVL